MSPHVEAMHARARRLVRSDDLAWDVVQDTLIRLWRHDRLPDAPRGVLLHAVFPNGLQSLRAERRRRFHEACACAECTEVDDGGDPSRTLQSDELAKRLAALVAALPAACRRVVELRHQGLDYAEIAERLRVPVGTVRSRLHRARERLRGALDESSLAPGARRSVSGRPPRPRGS